MSEARTGRPAYDYIIVGAGSAGCVLAERLSRDPEVSVLVLEYGGHAPWWDWRIHMPAGLSAPMNGTTYNWDYRTQPEAMLANRRIHQPRGKVLGGSSAINGMAYVRGHARDYDRWAGDPALAHWDYAHCLPYFRRAECHDRGADAYHGGDGPLYTETGRGWSPLYGAWIAAGREAGYGVTDDMNGERQEGVGPMQMTVHDGVRWSAWRAYLKPAMTRPNLTVACRALTTRVLFEGRRAVGVAYQHKGRPREAGAARRVILAGGAINSPQLLMLSGIGDGDHLRAHGLPVVQHLPGVGTNLQDHLELYVQQRCTQPVSLYPALRPLGKLKVALDWYLFQRGLGATNHFEAGGFIRSRAGVEHPDLQYHFLPLAIRYDGRAAAEGHGFQAHVGPMRSKSRGTVGLRSPDPRDPPVIRGNYMQHPEDWQEMRAAVRLTREIFAQAALDPYRGGEIAPGKNVKSDAEIDDWVARNAESAYHPSCTCPMGGDPDTGAVVDGDTAVHGVEGLNVVDSSIFPTIPSGNLNAPTIMVAEKAADLIAGTGPLAPSNAPVWVCPDWQTRQRESAAARPGGETTPAPGSAAAE